MQYLVALGNKLVERCGVADENVANSGAIGALLGRYWGAKQALLPAVLRTRMTEASVCGNMRFK